MHHLSVGAFPPLETCGIARAMSPQDDATAMTKLGRRNYAARMPMSRQRSFTPLR
jgi:hypothetical protein